MSHMMLLALAAAVLAAILAFIGIWSPRRLRVKLAAVACVALFLPVAYLALAELLSHPKPVDLAWAERNVPSAAVLGSHLVEDEAIYLWLGIEGEAGPRAYVLPWIRQLAEQLQDAQRQAEAEGTQVQMAMPFDVSMDNLEQKFHAAPQEALPPKPAPEAGAPVVFQRSHDGADPAPATN